MTEQDIMEVIAHDRFDASNITYEDLVRSYARCLARLSGEIRQFDFIELLALTALLHKKSHPGPLPPGDFSAVTEGGNSPSCPACGK